MPPTDKRACKGTTRAGKPCKAPPLHGGDFCMAHADAKTRESAGFIARNGKQGRPRKPTVIEAIREKVEAQADEVVAKLWHMANNAERAVVVGTGPQARVEIVPDHDLRLKALRELLDRSHGKPKQATEISGPDGGPIPTEPVVPTDDDWHREALEAAGELGLLVPPSPEVAAHGARNGDG